MKLLRGARRVESRSVSPPAWTASVRFSSKGRPPFFFLSPPAPHASRKRSRCQPLAPSVAPNHMRGRTMNDELALGGGGAHGGRWWGTSRSSKLVASGNSPLLTCLRPPVTGRPSLLRLRRSYRPANQQPRFVVSGRLQRSDAIDAGRAASSEQGERMIFQ
jgi:hypothetical protein